MANIMVGKPVKFRVLEILSDGAEMWNYEIVDKLSKEYRMTSQYERNSLNFDLVEICTSGFIEGIDESVDTDGSKLGSGRLLMKYRISEIGKKEYAWLAKNCRHAGVKKGAAA